MLILPPPEIVLISPFWGRVIHFIWYQVTLLILPARFLCLIIRSLCWCIVTRQPCCNQSTNFAHIHYQSNESTIHDSHNNKFHNSICKATLPPCSLVLEVTQSQVHPFWYYLWVVVIQRSPIRRLKSYLTAIMLQFPFVLVTPIVHSYMYTLVPTDQENAPTSPSMLQNWVVSSHCYNVS